MICINGGPKAEALCERLKAGSIRCWIAPRDILPGADWGGSIINAIGQSRAMVLVFSSHANDSQQIPHEVAYAVSAKVAVIQLRIEDVEPNDNLRYFLDTSQWLDAFASPFAQHLERIAEAVKGTLEQPREAAHPLLLRKASKWGLAHGVIASHWRSLVAGLGLIGFVAFVARSIANATNPTVVSIAKFGASVKCVTFSPNGRLVAAGSSDMTARVFEVLGGKEVLKLKLQGTVYGLAFSQDGRYLAVAGGGDKTVRVFTTLGGKEVSRLEVGDRDAVVAVAFSPDGHYVAAGVDDMTARVFEVAGGRRLLGCCWVTQLGWSPSAQTGDTWRQARSVGTVA
jgi:TIR domain/Eukaryotic translation initiation factor eIF2A